MKQAEAVAGWRDFDEASRRRVVESLRPHLREIATGLGAQTRSQRRDVLEAIAFAALTECGWHCIALGDRPSEMFL